MRIRSLHHQRTHLSRLSVMRTPVCSLLLGNPTERLVQAYLGGSRWEILLTWAQTDTPSLCSLVGLLPCLQGGRATEITSLTPTEIGA